MSSANTRQVRTYLESKGRLHLAILKSNDEPERTGFRSTSEFRSRIHLRLFGRFSPPELFLSTIREITT